MPPCLDLPSQYVCSLSSSDEAMVEALFIFHPRKARAASLLKALLIFRDVTLENMAIWMRLPVEVVTIWADRVSVRMHRHLELTDCPVKKVRRWCAREDLNLFQVHFGDSDECS